MNDVLLVSRRHLRPHFAGDGSDLLIEIVDFFEKALFLTVELTYRVPYQFFRQLLQLAQVLFNARQPRRFVVRVSLLLALHLRQPNQLMCKTS